MPELHPFWQTHLGRFCLHHTHPGMAHQPCDACTMLNQLTTCASHVELSAACVCERSAWVFARMVVYTCHHGSGFPAALRTLCVLHYTSCVDDGLCMYMLLYVFVCASVCASVCVRAAVRVCVVCV